MSDPVSDSGIYEFVSDAGAPPQDPVQPQAVIDPGTPAVLSYRTIKGGKPPPTETETIRNLYLPVALLLGGIFVQLLAGIVWTHQVLPAIKELALNLTLGTAVMLAAMLLAARLRQFNLGSIPIAALKLAAITTAPAALVQFVAPVTSMIFLGSIVGWVIEFMSFFALLGALFDLDESDTWFCVWTIFFTHVAFCLVTQRFI